MPRLILGESTNKLQTLSNFSDRVWAGVTTAAEPLLEQAYSHVAGVRGLDREAVVTAEQVHAARVATVVGSQVKQLSGVDAMITTDPGVVLSVRIADCAPIWLYDPQHHVIGLAHAGWRGAVAGVVKETVTEMQRQFSTQPTSLLIAIGPSLQLDHFEIQADMATEVTRQLGVGVSQFLIEDEALHFDLSGLLQWQLLELGVPIDHILVSTECTYCDEQKWFSYRRDHAPHRMVAAMQLVVT